MLHKSETAKFISACVVESKKSQSQIAAEAGVVDFAHIMAGTTQLPICKVGTVAKALHVDPVDLLAKCLREYCPDTWKSIGPFLDDALTEDELSLVRALRTAIGGPYSDVINGRGA